MSSKVISEDLLLDLEITKSFIIPHLISEIPKQKMIQEQYIPNLPTHGIYYPVIESFNWWEEDNFNIFRYDDDEIYYPSDILSILHIVPYYPCNLNPARQLGSHRWEDDDDDDDDIPDLEESDDESYKMEEVD